MKRKRISYAPMSDIEASRDDYLSNIYHKDDMSCLRMLRMRRAPFFLLSLLEAHALPRASGP